MVNWPKSLVREIVSRRCIFFLGAGVSASAKDSVGRSPSDWEQFIHTAAALIHESKKKKIIDNFIKQKNFLLALQGIVNTIDAGDYQDLLNRQFNNPTFNPSELHKIINALDARIVITTNFDKIYENFSTCAIRKTLRLPI
ncbi:MAG: hypothetical protein ACMUJM_25935 [bacterium]